MLRNINRRIGTQKKESTKIMRRKLSEKRKAEVRYESMNFCGNPCCFAQNSLDVHHINGNPSDNCPDNLIALCTGCHQPLHRGQRNIALDSERLLKYKSLFKDFIPGRTNSLPQVISNANRLYEAGNFDSLKLVSCILLKWVNFKNIITDHIPLVGNLYEYLAEVAVQRGQSELSLRLSNKALQYYKEVADFYRASHCYGLIALAYNQLQEPSIALPTIHLANKSNKLSSCDVKIQKCRIGWLSQIEACIYRNTSNYDEAYAAVSLATNYYSEAANVIADREMMQVPFEHAKILISTGLEKDLSLADTILSTIQKTVLASGWRSERSNLHFYRSQLLLAAGETNLAVRQLNSALLEALKAKSDQKVSKLLKIICSNENIFTMANTCLYETVRNIHGACNICKNKDLKSVAVCELRKIKTGGFA